MNLDPPATWEQLLINIVGYGAALAGVFIGLWLVECFTRTP